MNAKKLGKKIKMARIELDMTQKELEDAIHYRQTNISRCETGRLLPALETLKKMTIFFNKPFAYFLDD